MTYHLIIIYYNERCLLFGFNAGAEHKPTRGSGRMAKQSDTPSWTSERSGDKHSRAARDISPRESRLGREVSFILSNGLPLVLE